MTLKRILFVDDEMQVLDGLRNVLRKRRHEWEMVFVVGGAAALAELERAPFDVIVSDMRMPGMDGAALLQRVKELHPRTARIVLSGHADHEAILPLLPVAHQFLSKPCDESELHAVVQRVCGLQELLRDGATRGMVSRFEQLPSMPQAYDAISKALADPATTLDHLASLVEQDPSLVAKILQLVNSAYFGLRHGVTSIRQAVQYLGIDLLKGLALSGVFGGFKVADIEGFSVERFQRGALMTARLAKRIADAQRHSDDVFTAAVVHDVGQLILAHACRERFAEARRLAREHGRPSHLAEQEVFGTTHAEVGAYLLGVWGLPFTIVETAAYHHRPRAVASGERHVLATVYLADQLLAARDEQRPPDDAPLDLEFLKESGLNLDTEGWARLVSEECQAA